MRAMQVYRFINIRFNLKTHLNTVICVYNHCIQLAHVKWLLCRCGRPRNYTLPDSQMYCVIPTAPSPLSPPGQTIICSNSITAGLTAYVNVNGAEVNTYAYVALWKPKCTVPCLQVCNGSACKLALT